METVLFASASGLAAIWLGVHTFVGGRQIATPLVEATALPSVVRHTQYLCWHFTTVAIAAMAGMLFGLVHATLTVPFGLSQHVVGLGVTLLATSATYFAYRVALPEVSSPPRIEAFQTYEVPLLSDLPLVGEALFSQTPR